MNLNFVSNLLLLLGIGGVGAILGLRLKIPAGVFLGPIVLVGAYQVAFGTIMEKPYWIRLAMQIAVGIVLGTKLTKNFIADFNGLIKPVLVACAAMFCGALLLGFMLKVFTGWDLTTSILSTAPGGQAEMAMLSDSIGAETEKVIILQLIRNQLVLIVMLPLARIFFRKREKEVMGH
jgi:membrane AbrB-like protein